MLSAQRIADTVLQVMSNKSAGLFVFWHHVIRDRNALRDDLARTLVGTGVVPLVLHGARFLTPNAVLSDLLALIEENKDAFSSLDPYPSDAPIGVILLSRSELDVPQCSSPAVMPKWMPRLGGQEVYAHIQDLTYTGITAPFNDPQLMERGLKKSLYDLESALVDRLLATREYLERPGNSLWDRLREESEYLSYGGFLRVARKYLDSVSSQKAYRPSARNDDCFSSRLIRICAKSSPDQLRKIAKALASALVLGKQEIFFPSPPAVAFLYRPSSPDPTPAISWGRGIIIAVFSEAQLCNAAAHADEYPEYPYLYLRYIFDDTIEYLIASSNMLRNLRR